MGRYRFYVDGFNLYHALEDGYQQYKWLNLRKLAEAVVGPHDTIEGICFFTAYARWKPRSVARHKTYVKALRSQGIEIVQGRFMRKQVKCHLCHREYWTHQEKRSDVNIALRILIDAISDAYDTALIVSADSDLLPAIDAVHVLAADKEIGIMIPIGRPGSDLKRHADFRRRMPEQLLRDCQFPNEVRVGRAVVRKPSDWPSP